MTDIDSARAHIAEIASRAEAGDLFCIQTLAAIVILLEHTTGGGDDDGDGITIDNVIDLCLFRRAA